MGGSSRIHFWHNVWCLELALKESFSILCKIARDGDAMVEKWLEGGGEDALIWVPRLRRELRNEEAGDLVNLLRDLEARGSDGAKAGRLSFFG